MTLLEKDVIVNNNKDFLEKALAKIDSRDLSTMSFEQWQSTMTSSSDERSLVKCPESTLFTTISSKKPE